MRHYLDVQAVADRYGWSCWSIYEKARHSAIPHRKPSGSNRLLFVEGELDLWDDGVPLQTRRLPHGGRVVVPRAEPPDKGVARRTA